MVIMGCFCEARSQEVRFCDGEVDRSFRIVNVYIGLLTPKSGPFESTEALRPPQALIFCTEWLI